MYIWSHFLSIFTNIYLFFDVRWVFPPSGHRSRMKWRLYENVSLSRDISSAILNDVVCPRNTYSKEIMFTWTFLSTLCLLKALHRHLQAQWWRHQMETFSAILDLCAGNSPVLGEFATQRPVTRSFEVFLWAKPRINGWINNRYAGDLRRHRAHYDVIVMSDDQVRNAGLIPEEIILGVQIELHICWGTYWGPVTHICVSELGHLWPR